MSFKDLVKHILKKSPIALSKNHQYDILTHRIIKNHLVDGTIAIDIGAHKGEILDLFIKYSPKGNHLAFEPLPILYNKLKHKYREKVTVYNIALSDKKGETSFHHVVSNPAYSGIMKRNYDRRDEEVEVINVPTDKLDNLIAPDLNIALIKIDVEGGEYLVLHGSQELLKRDKPLIIFEHGLGGSDVYGHPPEDLYALLVNTLDYSLYTLSNLNSPLTEKAFSSLFYAGKEYYFLAM